jgi:uncharacterized protein (DUF433 family)
MKWQTYIGSDPDVLSGKPVIKGTRLAVDFILGLMAEGWTLEQLYQNYPALNPVIMQAVFSYASECLRDEKLFVIKSKAA